MCNHSYGTICAPIDKETGRRVVQNRIILKKNTPLPCEISQTFYTVSEGQKRVEVTITQGEDADPAYVNRIATHSLELPPDRPAERPIKVTYSYDLNQRMHCAFQDMESGRLLELDFSLDEDGTVADEAAEQAAETRAVQGAISPPWRRLGPGSTGQVYARRIDQDHSSDQGLLVGRPQTAACGQSAAVVRDGKQPAGQGLGPRQQTRGQSRRVRRCRRSCAGRWISTRSTAACRIGRQPDGESCRSVIVIDICGTIQAPADGHEVELRVAIQDVTDKETESLPILNRPKQRPAEPLLPIRLSGRHGKAVPPDDAAGGLDRGRPDLAGMVRPAAHRPATASGTACRSVSRQTGEQLACSDCLGTYENTETGYLDVEDNIQRAKTLAVGLAFSVGAANGQLLDPEVNVIYAWVKTNFGSADASAGARLELERALQKTASFFRRGGTLDLPQICGEIVEIAPLIGRIEILDLCLRVAAAKGQVTSAELQLLKNLADWLQVDRARLRAMVEKILPVEMHQGHDAEMILGVTTTMSQDEARVQLNREYAKWSSRVISTDPSIRRQADQMLRLLGEARTQYVGAKSGQ